MTTNQSWVSSSNHQNKIFHQSGIFGVRFYLTALMTILLCGFPIFVIAVEPHKTENTRNTPDQTLRSTARVNPGTLAMELSIPIADFPGRGGLGMPLVFNYSSKIWRLELSGYGETETVNFTKNIVRYSEKSAMGWTSSFGTAQIEAFEDLYDCHGNPLGEAENHVPPPSGTLESPPGYCGSGIYYITRVRVKLPDGSTQELRKDDFIHERGTSPIDWTGTYLATDGTRSRLEMGETSSVLYLPDGSRYYFQTPTNGTEQIGYRYEDRHGNRVDFNVSTRTWTDTMGRSLTSPVPLNLAGQQQTAGTQTFTVPGLTGADSRQYQLIWKNLADTGVLLNGNETLAYLGNSINCPYNNTESNALFFGSPETRICRGEIFNPVVLTEIVLPNQVKYKFWYNRYGEITKVEYPTGAYERFEYDDVPTLSYRTDMVQDQLNRGVVNRWVRESSSAPELHWKYEPFKAVNQYVVRTTAPDNFTITEQYLESNWTNGLPQWRTRYGFENPVSGRPYEERVYAGTTLKSRKLTEYSYTEAVGGGNAPATRNPRTKREITVIFEPDSNYALATMTENTYDVGGSSDLRDFSALNLKTKDYYNFILVEAGTSTSPARTENVTQLAARFSNFVPVSRTEIDYLYNSNYNGANYSMLGMVAEQRVINPANSAVVSKTQMRYDEFTLISSGSLPTFANGRWIDPNNSYRGNVTSVRHYTDPANNQYIETHSHYDQYGNLRKLVDGRSYESQMEYSTDYACAYLTKTITPVPDINGVYGANSALVTTVSYDLNTGLPRFTTDPNNQTTEIQYNDLLLRPTKTIAPNGQETITEYGVGTSAATRFVKVKTQIDAEHWKEGYTFSDGLNRPIKTQSVDSNGDIFTITNYDEMGRIREVSNPFRNVSNPSCAANLECTTTVYDNSGRVWKVTTPDGAVTETTYSLAIAGNQIGTVTTVKDAAARERRLINNGLGQLIRVDEPNDAGQLGTIQSPNQPTVYGYNLLNNLTSVTQGAQTRSFVYDAASRLTSTTNPESGTISYTYDANGNLLTKTDARGVVTSYVYDPLNRVKSRSYSNEPSGQTPTPTVTYFYDNLPYAKGKLRKTSNSFSTTEFTAFDSSGRPTGHQQTTDGQSYTTGYVYNLSGGLIEQTYPSGRVVKNVLDSDGALSVVRSKKNQQAGFWNYAAHFNYTPSGSVSAVQLGNGNWESTAFNSRLQPIQVALGTTQNSTNLLKLDFTYNTPNAADNNGNLHSQTITVPTIGNNQGFTAIQSYTYDSLNRIKEAAETISNNQTWKQTFSYDRYGNRNFDLNNTTQPNLQSGATKVINPEILAADNRFKQDQDNDNTADYLYDASGNTKQNAQGRIFVYDGENKQIEVLENNVSIGKYFYDGDGRRIKKVSATETVIFIYDAAGKLIAEFANQTSQMPRVSYLTTDHLSSPRINTDAMGSVISRHDYQPFGEEVQRAGYGTDEVRKQFTGYERDEETKLDFAQARMFGSFWGRFTSPDPALVSASAENPQTWNRYAYVLNNPLKYSDPLGLWEIDPNYEKTTETTSKGKTKVTDVKVILKKQEGDDVKSLAKQLNISEKAAQKIFNKADANGNIRLSEAGGQIGKVFKGIEDLLEDHEQFKIDNGGKPGVNLNNDGWDCTQTASSLAGEKMKGTGTVDHYLKATIPEPNGLPTSERLAQSVSQDKLQTGDMLRYALNNKDKATHFATFLMFNKGGEPVVFSKSGEKGPYEFGKASDIGRRNNYGTVTPVPDVGDKTGNYRWRTQ